MNSARGISRGRPCWSKTVIVSLAAIELLWKRAEIVATAARDRKGGPRRRCIARRFRYIRRGSLVRGSEGRRDARRSRNGARRRGDPVRRGRGTDERREGEEAGEQTGRETGDEAGGAGRGRSRALRGRTARGARAGRAAAPDRAGARRAPARDLGLGVLHQEPAPARLRLAAQGAAH